MGDRVCFVSSRSGYCPGDGTLIMDWANGRLINALFKNKEYQWSLAIFSDPVRVSSYDYQISPEYLFKLPFPFNYGAGLRNSWKIYQQLRQIASRHDVLIVQLPIISFIPLLFIRKRIIYHVCANVSTAAANPYKYRGVRRMASGIFAWFMTWVFRQLFARSNSRLIVNGGELGQVFRSFNPEVVVSSSIESTELAREHAMTTRSEDVFRLLFIGRPSMEKGINVLMEAYSRLIEQGVPVQLEMIGVTKEELATGLRSLHIPDKHLDKVIFHGFLSWSEPFRNIIRKSHALVMCSVSEGTPRVILEAMSQGCPVIATAVGGVPTVVNEGNGILIPPGNADGLADAVKYLVINEQARIKMAHAGLQTASMYTLDKFASVFLDLLHKLKTHDDAK